MLPIFTAAVTAVTAARAFCSAAVSIISSVRTGTMTIAIAVPVTRSVAVTTLIAAAVAVAVTALTAAAMAAAVAAAGQDDFGLEGIIGRRVRIRGEALAGARRVDMTG